MAKNLVKVLLVILISIFALNLPISSMAAMGDYEIFKLDLECIDNFIILNYYNTPPYNLFRNSRICKRTQVQNIYSKMAEQLTDGMTEDVVYPVFEKVTFEVVIDALNNGIASVEAVISEIPKTLAEKGVNIEKYNSVVNKEALHNMLGEMNFADMDDFAAKLSEAMGDVPISFSDMSAAEWAIPAVEALASKGIVNGKGNNMFCPNDLVTRAEFAKMLVGAMGIKTAVADGFADVTEDAWYTTFVGGVVNAGYMKGYGELFGVNNPLTREEMVTAINRILMEKKCKFSSEDAIKFADADDIADFAVEAVNALSSAGIVNGVSGGEFAPKQPATRAQVAKILYNIIKIFEATEVIE